MMSINCEINRVIAKSGQRQLLDYEDERRRCSGVSRAESHLGRRIQSWHNRLTVRVYKLDSNRLGSFFNSFEPQLNG